jgi:hypothetical protein
MNAPRVLWRIRYPDERRKLLLTMVDAVYIDAKQTRSIVALKTKPPPGSGGFV